MHFKVRFSLIIVFCALFSTLFANSVFAASTSPYKNLRPASCTLQAVASATIYDPATHTAIGQVTKYSDGCGHVQATTSSYVGMATLVEAEIYSSNGSYLTNSSRQFATTITTALITTSGNSHACGIVDPEGSTYQSGYACTIDTY